jgi:2-dehydro-3-deoxyphosphogluconate aldolase/(4S)-4-hydroxy-2-oxoglutarate aldolase
MNPSQALTALQVMQDAPVIPVIVLHDVAHAVPMARALVAGGIRMLEVTLRTPQALACMEAIARDVPEAVVGAGTVRSPADAQAAARVGARFAVSPGYTTAVGQACRDAVLALLPGVATAARSCKRRKTALPSSNFSPPCKPVDPPCSRPGAARFLTYGFAPPVESPCTTHPSCWPCPMWCA